MVTRASRPPCGQRGTGPADSCDLADVGSDWQQRPQIGDLGQRIVDRSVREADDGGTQRAAALLDE